MQKNKYFCLMQFIDTHTHLYSEEFDSDRDKIINKAFDNNIYRMLLPNIDEESIIPMHKLCDAYPREIFPMMGLHPTSVKGDYIEMLAKIKLFLDQRKYIAIGEIGIDLYWDTTFAEQQKDALMQQFQWSIDYDLPVVIHSRDSLNEIINCIDEFNNNKLHGVFHCFTGSSADANEIISRGFLLGIGGVLTFKNSGLSDQIKNIDMEHFILETDSPYLTPAPHRGKRNESSYISLIAQKLAHTKDISIEEVAEITTNNANKLFKI